MKNNLIQFFTYQHLPEHLQAISKPFGELAKVLETLPNNPEKTTAFRKLIEAKDCAVRASLFKDPNAEPAAAETSAPEEVGNQETAKAA